MNKKQMSLWLVENILRWKQNEAKEYMWKVPKAKLLFPEGVSVTNFIYSPEGFFTVWDAVEKKRNYCTMIKTKDGEYICHLSDNNDLNRSRSKDRYGAFYKAVYEAMSEGLTQTNEEKVEEV